MFIPVFTHVKFVDDDGFLSIAMQDYNDLLNQALQNGLSDSGWTSPMITAANIVAIAPSMPDGTFWYETDNKEVVFKINGALRKVTTTAYP
jgi:hypothetical protein